MTFANNIYLLLLLLVIPFVVWYILKGRKSNPTLSVPTIGIYKDVQKSYKYYLIHLPFILKMVAFVMLVLILVRPQTTDKWENSEIEGIDIMLCVDISTSMLAEDLKPNRLEAAKSVAAEFINGRPNDNIGLTVFAGEAYTQCPMTIDHAMLLNLFNSVSSDIVLSGAVEDGTAIGMGLANAISRLKDSKAKSKVIILLTDGSNNRGEISPLTAAEMAKTFGIRVYTIGVGSNGTAPYPMQTYGGSVQYVNVPVEIDEDMLRDIAINTNGIYYRADSNSRLLEIYQEIDKLEKTKLQVKEFSRNNEAFEPFAWVLLIALLLSMILKQTVLRTIP
ncbi:MAG: VWA domain-containing protein [Bacteroidaceae bacterium]|nr:VWA domain-containing protein [Bacteroidaceae bacterium]